jgi:hypothetical protein
MAVLLQRSLRHDETVAICLNFNKARLSPQEDHLYCASPI